MAPSLNLSDEELLGCARSVSPDALALLYRRHEPGVLAYFVRRVEGNSEVAADLTAQTFLHVVEGRSRFVGTQPGDATAWMYGIAAHVLSRHWRRKGADSRRYERLISTLTPLDETQTAEIDRLTEDGPLMHALSHLPEPQREAVHAFVLGDRTYDEIADAASIGPAAARKRVSRGLATLAAMRSARREGR